MKKANFIVNIALVPIDFTIVILAALSAYFLRFSDYVKEIRPIIFELSFDDFLPLVLKVSFLAQAVLLLNVHPIHIGPVLAY